MGCEDELLELPPFPEAAKSAVLVAIADGALTFHALDVEDSAPIHVQADELLLGTYHLTLEELSLENGPFERPSSPPCAWADPLMVFSGTPGLTFEAAAPEPFVLALVPDASRRCRRCPTFTE
ncbi:MAG: hypothetical protein HYZ27_05135, partial [Deltaproteobacteria bacterium]|nr:hypothetical protein [Deltaproteobacteria bacterium]